MHRRRGAFLHRSGRELGGGAEHRACGETRTSGADDPRAISVRFAIVAFQTLTSTLCRPIFTTRVLDVMTSIASMKRSAMMETPKKK